LVQESDDSCVKQVLHTDGIVPILMSIIFDFMLIE
jgi:hypothetical protein